MTSPNNRLPRPLLIAAMACSIALGAAGCEKEKKKAAPPPPPPPAPVATIPDPVDASAVLQQLQADARVQFPQAQSPADRTLAEGIVKLANFMAKGDAAGMKTMLAPPAQLILDELVSTGGWAEETKAIEQVRVVSVSGTQEERAESSQIAFAIQGKDGAFLLAWRGARNGDNWVFQNAPCQADIKPRASDFDGVSINAGTSVAAMATEEPDAPQASRPAATPAGAAPEPITKNPREKSTPSGPINIPGGSR